MDDKAVRLGMEVDELFMALEKLAAFIAAEVDSEVENRLMEPAYRMREGLERDFWSAHVAQKSAERIAELGPGEHVSAEAAHEFTELLERSNALGTAIAVLEDAPEEVFGHQLRWPVIAGLVAVKETLSEEVSGCKERVGLK